jgi:predicted sugar kinase
MGFIDLSASLGRKFGSIGVALNEINTHISISAASELCSVGLQSERASGSSHNKHLMPYQQLRTFASPNPTRHVQESMI